MRSSDKEGQHLKQVTQRKSKSPIGKNTGKNKENKKPKAM